MILHLKSSLGYRSAIWEIILKIKFYDACLIYFTTVEYLFIYLMFFIKFKFFSKIFIKFNHFIRFIFIGAVKSVPT